MTVPMSQAQSSSETQPLRVAIAGLVHGHVAGFFERSLHRPEIQLVGIAEPDQQLASRYATQFNLDRSLLFTDLEDMLQKTHPAGGLGVYQYLRPPAGGGDLRPARGRRS